MSHVPDAGDIVWTQFSPQVGCEQAGYRPALVLSSKTYNRPSRLMLACPCTTKIKDYPYEVRLAGQPPSVALIDQLRSLDWGLLPIRFLRRASAGELDEARAKLATLVGLSA